MSLKAIRYALSLARARRGFGDTEEEMLADAAAQAEIAALEEAAKSFVTPVDVATRITAREFDDLMITIAKEAE